MERVAINEEVVKPEFGASVNKIISMLLTPSILEKWLINHGFTAQREYTLELLLQHFSPFCQKHQLLLQGYFSGLNTLNGIANQFINYLGYRHLDFDAETMFSNAVDYVRDAEKEIEKILNQRTAQNKLNVLGFGLGDGLYEEKIKSKLLSTGLYNEVNLYGYDPITLDSFTKGINKITKADLEIMKQDPIIDVIITRWVLHHTSLDHRWNDLTLAINACRSKADIIIVEESSLVPTSASRTYENKLEELILGIFDVIVNMGLHPHWFQGENEGSFFLKYLYQEDFKFIESKISRLYHKHKQTLDYSIHSQQIIHYALIPFY